MPSISKLKEAKSSLDKKFKHCFLKEFDAYNVDSETEGRHYVTPDGVFKSVTTFLSALDTDTEWLAKWAIKLGGQDKADAELKRCGDRGTAVHLALEHLVRNTPNPELAGEYQFMYRHIASVLSIHVDDIYGLEIPLWSNVLGLAGRVDCIAKYKGELCIIDFKTSSKPKQVDWITNYFLQTTCYSIMLQERYGLIAKKLVIIIGVESPASSQIFVRDRGDYTLLLSEKIKEFRNISENKPKKVSMFEDFSI